MSPQQFVRQPRETLEPRRNPARAAAMARYMKDRFPFPGLERPEHQAVTKPLLARVKGEVDEPWLSQTARLLWALPEGEFPYAACELLTANRNALSPRLAAAEKLLTEKSWWDGVDMLSGGLVGPLVLRFPQLKAEMGGWSRHENFWLRRSALIHQLSYQVQTDAERLLGYRLDNAPDKEFFIRKGIGWALRQYARTDRAAVYAFVERHRDKFAPLTVREA